MNETQVIARFSLIKSTLFAGAILAFTAWVLGEPQRHGVGLVDFIVSVRRPHMWVFSALGTVFFAGVSIATLVLALLRAPAVAVKSGRLVGLLPWPRSMRLAGIVRVAVRPRVRWGKHRIDQVVVRNVAGAEMVIGAALMNRRAREIEEAIEKARAAEPTPHLDPLASHVVSGRGGS